MGYEAGPTGFGLALQLIVAACGVWSLPRSKLQWQTANRIKTDGRDALLLAPAAPSLPITARVLAIPAKRFDRPGGEPGR